MRLGALLLGAAGRGLRASPACLQVPAPLRPEVEAQQLERRRAQQVRRRQREQVRRDEQRRQEQEEEEKRRFAALPERDKVRSRGVGQGTAGRKRARTLVLMPLCFALLRRGPWQLSGGWRRSCRSPARHSPTAGNGPHSRPGPTRTCAGEWGGNLLAPAPTGFQAGPSHAPSCALSLSLPWVLLDAASWRQLIGSGASAALWLPQLGQSLAPSAAAPYPRGRAEQARPFQLLSRDPHALPPVLAPFPQGPWLWVAAPVPWPTPCSPAPTGAAGSVASLCWAVCPSTTSTAPSAPPPACRLTGGHGPAHTSTSSTRRRWLWPAGELPRGLGWGLGAGWGRGKGPGPFIWGNLTSQLDPGPPVPCA